VHVLKADKKPPPFKEPRRDKEKQNFQESETKRVSLDRYLPGKEVTISATLAPEEEQSLLDFLNKNQDVFAWSASDLHGVSRDIIEHNLDIDPKVRPKK
jgi:hypothetical protein